MFFRIKYFVWFNNILDVAINFSSVVTIFGVWQCYTLNFNQSTEKSLEKYNARFIKIREFAVEFSKTSCQAFASSSCFNVIFSDISEIQRLSWIFYKILKTIQIFQNYWIGFIAWIMYGDAQLSFFFPNVYLFGKKSLYLINKILRKLSVCIHEFIF